MYILIAFLHFLKKKRPGWTRETIWYGLSDLYWGWFRSGTETVGLEYWKLINTELI